MRNISAISNAFASHEAGQGYFDFLLAIGKSPKEFGSLEPDERAFMMLAWNERCNRLIQQGG